MRISEIGQKITQNILKIKPKTNKTAYKTETCFRIGSLGNKPGLHEILKMSKKSVKEIFNIVEDLFNMFNTKKQSFVNKSKLFGQFGKEQQKLAEKGLIKFNFIQGNGNVLLERIKVNSHKSDIFVKKEEDGILNGIFVLRRNKEGKPIFSMDFNYNSNDCNPHVVQKFYPSGTIQKKIFLNKKYEIDQILKYGKYFDEDGEQMILGKTTLARTPYAVIKKCCIKD